MANTARLRIAAVALLAASASCEGRITTGDAGSATTHTGGSGTSATSASAGSVAGGAGGDAGAAGGATTTGGGGGVTGTGGLIATGGMGGASGMTIGEGGLTGSGGFAGAGGLPSTGGLAGGTGGVAGSGGSAPECLSAADCPVSLLPCQLAACESGTCTLVALPFGVPSPDLQVIGDCAMWVCDGAGGEVEIADDTDIPADANECTLDLCAGGVPANVPVPPGSPCGVGQACSADGQCGCADDSQCLPPETCGGGNPGTPYVCGCTKSTCASLNRTCGSFDDGCGGTVTCDGTKDGDETDVDCGGNTTCPTLCAQGKTCNVNADCAAGPCVDGVCCDTACVGSCLACSTAKKGGGANGVCGPIAAGADPDNECPTQLVKTCGTTGSCNGSGACQLYAAGVQCAPAACVFDANLLSGPAYCNGTGTCVYPPLQDCSPLACMGNACGPGGYWGPCSSGAQCASGFCADGYCCNTPCVGLCQACTAVKKGMGMDGICGAIAAGLDPDNECPGAQTCSGAGSCQ